MTVVKMQLDFNAPEFQEASNDKQVDEVAIKVVKLTRYYGNIIAMYPEEMRYVMKCREKAKRMRAEADRWEILSQQAIQKCFGIWPQEPIDEECDHSSVHTESVTSPQK